MLILSRKVGERIVIGDDIWVTVLELSQGKVRLGIAAPENIRIDREEIRKQRDLESQENQ